MTTQTVTQISAAARGKWPVILQMLRIDVPENGRHGSCPKCGGKDRFRLDDLDGRGTWICSQCGNGDGLDLVKLMTGYGVRKAAQEVAQVLNVPDVQELPVKPARQKAPKRDMSLTVAALMKESHTGESPYLNGKGFAGYPASLTGSVQHISGKDFPAGSLLLPLTTNAGAVIQNVKICNPLRVTAITCDADGGNFGRLLEWEDTWGERRRCGCGEFS